jgi:hypothetical protein
MPDISLCKNKICPLSEQCYRFKAQPDEFRQAYSEFEPDDDGNCEFFILDKNIFTNDYESDFEI